MCKMKQRERLGGCKCFRSFPITLTLILEGRYQSISKSDASFFHHLFTRDARNHLPRLRKIASTTYPSLTRTALIICIDYTVLPPKYSLVPIAEYEKHQPPTRGSSNAEARNEALIERARDNPEKFTIIQSKIANGQGLQLVLTVVTGSFWKDGPDAWNEGLNEGIEEVDGEETGEQKQVKEGNKAKPSDADHEFSGRRMDEVDMMMAGMTLNGLLQKLGHAPAF
jgi:hypothetical protein